MSFTLMKQASSSWNINVRHSTIHFYAARLKSTVNTWVVKFESFTASQVAGAFQLDGSGQLVHRISFTIPSLSNKHLLGYYFSDKFPWLPVFVFHFPMFYLMNLTNYKKKKQKKNIKCLKLRDFLCSSIFPVEVGTMTCQLSSYRSF